MEAELKRWLDRGYRGLGQTHRAEKDNLICIIRNVIFRGLTWLTTFCLLGRKPR